MMHYLHLSIAFSVSTPDCIVELSLHKVMLKSLHSHLYSCIKLSHQDDGSLQRLLENQRVLVGRSLEELEGSAGAGVPDAAMLEKIQHRWSTMHQEYLPQKKVDTLLKVCKNIYHSITANAKSGECLQIYIVVNLLS